MATKKEAESTGLYTAGFVLGIIGVVFSFIPLCYWIGYILGGLALIFGIIGLVKKAPGHKALVSTILGGVALVISLIMNIQTIKAAEQIMDTIIDGSTDTILDVLNDYESDVVGKYVDVQILGYQEVDDDWDDHAVVVKVTNISDKTRSFSIGIEAVDENGDRLDESSFYAENLAPGQSQTFNTFTLSTLSDEVLGNATYKVYQSSTY